jgi:hypothetical protein
MSNVVFSEYFINVRTSIQTNFSFTKILPKQIHPVLKATEEWRVDSFDNTREDKTKLQEKTQQETSRKRAFGFGFKF